MQQYVQELGLWGFNSIEVWYDMRYAKTFDDPEAGAFRARLKGILQSARDVGMGAALMVIGNEADLACPKEFWADPRAQRGDFVREHTCPSLPGGMAYTLKVMGRLFDWGSDLRPEYVCIWPYDPGSCGCDQCRPWGANGFLKCAGNVARLAKQKLPGVKIVVSTWYFSNEEWKGLQEKWRVKPDWADIVLADWRADSPGGLPLVGFPEISMRGMIPWGGYGADPAPHHVNDEWNARKNILAGGWPYSEGIYEDIDKVLYGQFYWSPDKSAAETVSEYAAFEFSPAVAADVVKIVTILEENLGHEGQQGQCKNHIQASAREAFALAQRIDGKLTPAARRNWRWRILYLRALIDRELFEKKGKLEGQALSKAFDELKTIYHAGGANPVLKPPF